MSAPLVWIVFPGLAALVLFVLRRYERSIVVAGIGVALLLALLAWQLPIGSPIPLGPRLNFPGLQLSDTLFVLGRRFTLTDDYRSILGLIYLAVALWYGGAFAARATRLFVPLGLAIAAFLTASLAVEPFLYAALLIEIAALISVPILSPPGRRVGRGVIRFLTFQTLGMPFILFTGWMLTGVEANPGNTDLAVRVILLMGLGFAVLMAVFPFHTWIPLTAEEAHPYAASFVFFVVPTVVSLFALGFIEHYVWLRTSPLLLNAIQIVGILMVLTGGVLSAFQRHLGRILGYTATIEVGFSLLALSLGLGLEDPASPLLGIFFAQFLPRGVSMAVWALALATLQARAGDLRFRAVQGLAYELPVASAALAIAHFSLAGFPLLAGFPVRVALWTALAGQQSASSGQPQIIAILALVGSAGLLFAGLRTLAVLLTRSPQQSWAVSESRPQMLLLTLGGAFLLLIGLLPQWFMPTLTQVARLFGSGE